MAGFSAYAFVLYFFALNAICQPNCQRVIWANEVLMRVDNAIASMAVTAMAVVLVRWLLTIEARSGLYATQGI